MAEIRCPHCQLSFELAQTASVPDEQLVEVTIEAEHGCLCLETAAETMKSVATTMEAVAAKIGAKVATFLDGVQFSDGKFSFVVKVVGVKEANEP